MEYRIKFFIKASERQIGVKQVHEIRKEAGCNVPLERISGEVSPRIFLWGDVPERVAEKSGRFHETNRVEVELNPDTKRYLFLVPVIVRDEETGEVKSARMEWAFDTGLFLFDWEAAGFPDKL